MPAYRVIERFNKTGKDLSKFVVASASSIYQNSGEFSPSNLFLESNNYIFHSTIGVGQWVRFDFINSPIKIIGFEITSSTNRDPLNWKLEGTNDGVVFKDLYKNDGKAMCEYKGISNGYQCQDFTLNRYDLSSSATF